MSYWKLWMARTRSTSVDNKSIVHASKMFAAAVVVNGITML